MNARPRRITARPVRVRFFTPTAGRERSRRATDAILAAVTATLLVGTVLIAHPPSGFEKALIDLVAAIPGFLDVVWRLAVALLIGWAVVITVATVVRGRWGVLSDVLLATAIALGVAWLVGMVTDTERASHAVPALLVAVCAVVGAARPHLGRPFRSTGRSLLFAGSLGWILTGNSTPVAVVTAVLIGALAAAVDHLVLGSDDGRPDERTVAQALADLGIEVDSLAAARRQSAGVFTVEAVTATADPLVGGRTLVVKVYGRDAWDTQFLARTWRALWYRDVETIAATRLQQVEHEAFVTLLATSRGIPAPGVVTAGPTPTNDAILVLDDVGTPLVAAESGQLQEIWSLLDALHDAGLGLGDVAPSKLSVRQSADIGLSDLSTATSAPTVEELAIDRAQLLVSTVVLLGAGSSGVGTAVATAVNAAHQHLGDDGLAAIAPFLQPAAMGPSLLRELRGLTGSVDIAEIRAQVGELCPDAVKEMAQLRRVSVGSLVRMALLSVAGYSVISLLGGTDFDTLATQLSGGTYAWMLVAVVLTQLTYGAQVVSTQGASPTALPAGPLTALQAAISFVNLAVPSTAARVVMIVRFFERQGVRATSAVTISAVESFAGFLVQVSLLLLLLIPGFVDLDLNVDFPPGIGRLVDVLIWLVAIGAAATAIAAVVPSIRSRVVERISAPLQEVRGVLESLTTPVKLMQLLGGNLAAQMLLAAALGASARVFGADVSLAEALVVFIIASLFGGLMPVPGGIGVTEAALMVGLVAVDVDEATAFAVAITFRIATFYLPPAWGWFAYRWLERNHYL